MYDRFFENVKFTWLDHGQLLLLDILAQFRCITHVFLPKLASTLANSPCCHDGMSSVTLRQPGDKDVCQLTLNLLAPTTVGARINP